MLIQREQVEQMSAQDFAAMGAEQVAYIKPVTHEGEPAYAVHAADGTALAVVAGFEEAYALVRQNDLEPVAAH
jgi:hypothetical protein